MWKLHFFDDHVADLTAWLRSSAYLAHIKEFPPAPIDHNSLRATAPVETRAEIERSHRRNQ